MTSPFRAGSSEGLSDESRSEQPNCLAAERVAEMIERTLTTTPADATHWSLRSMAQETDLSHTKIRRIWGAFGLQPHRCETFKLSSDPLFPDRALVLCVDEKSQIQALDRTHPVLPSTTIPRC